MQDCRQDGVDDDFHALFMQMLSVLRQRRLDGVNTGETKKRDDNDDANAGVAAKDEPPPSTDTDLYQWNKHLIRVYTDSHANASLLRREIVRIKTEFAGTWNPEGADNDGNTLLHLLPPLWKDGQPVSAETLEEAVEVLVDAGVPLEAENRHGETPLLAALRHLSKKTHGTANLAMALIRQGATAECHDNLCRNALMFFATHLSRAKEAVAGNLVELLEALLHANATEIDEVDTDGQTALAHLCEARRANLQPYLQMMLDAGADPRAGQRLAISAWGLAVTEEDVDAIAVLHQYDPDAPRNFVDANTYNTLLHVLVKASGIEGLTTARLLVGLGAQVDAANAKGRIAGSYFSDPDMLLPRDRQMFLGL